jgi:hypothetical protein
MKSLSVILFAGTFVVIGLSCSDSNAKETPIKTGGASTKGAVENLITYKVNGKLVTTTGWNISRFKLTNVSKESLNVTTNMHEEKRTLNINISGIEPGEYAAATDDKSDHNFYGSYFPDYLDDLSNNYTFQAGTFIITKIDTIKNILNANFSGTAKNIKGETIDISDGKIVTGKLTPGVTKYE